MLHGHGCCRKRHWTGLYVLLAAPTATQTHPSRSPLLWLRCLASERARKMSETWATSPAIPLLDFGGRVADTLATPSWPPDGLLLPFSAMLAVGSRA